MFIKDPGSILYACVYRVECTCNSYGHLKVFVGVNTRAGKIPDTQSLTRNYPNSDLKYPTIVSTITVKI